MHFLVNPIKCSFLKLSLLIISFKFSSKNKVRKKLKGGALPLLLQTLLIYNLQLQSPHCDACVHAQSCLTLCNSMGCIPLGSSVQGIFQARILEWVAMPSLQWIFPTQELNLSLLHLLRWQVDCLLLRYQRSPKNSYIPRL